MHSWLQIVADVLESIFSLSLFFIFELEGVIKNCIITMELINLNLGQHCIAIIILLIAFSTELHICILSEHFVWKKKFLSLLATSRKSLIIFLYLQASNINIRNGEKRINNAMLHLRSFSCCCCRAGVRENIQKDFNVCKC
jgi:hypothetical protein